VLQLYRGRGLVDLLAARPATMEEFLGEFRVGDYAARWKILRWDGTRCGEEP
jgi:hypothetical protein